MQMRKIVKLGFLISLIVIPGYFPSCDYPVGQHQYDNAIRKSRRLIDSIRQSTQVPGIDLAVSIEGQVVWSEAFGYADLEHRTPVVAGVTKFRIGSVSKALTATSLGKLIDESKLDLKKKIQFYVPEFPEKQYSIYIRQVAAHTSGLRSYKSEQEYLQTDYFPNVGSTMAFFAEDSLEFEPGTRFGYTTLGYNVLAAVIESASGIPYLDYMQKAVFEPLNMKSTCADRNDKIITNRTSFYSLDSANSLVNAPYVNNSYKWAGGGFLSTTHDLIKLGEAYFESRLLIRENNQVAYYASKTKGWNATQIWPWMVLYSG